MAISASDLDQMPVVASRDDFDNASGKPLERLIFNHRHLVVFGILAVTVLLGFFSLRLELNASFEKMMPTSHPFIQNYKQYSESLGGLGNSVRVVVENQNGDIYDPEYIETLKKINDQVFLIRGVDRAYMKSIWMPVVRWTEITEEGYKGGPVMPDTYDGTQKSIDQLKFNVGRAGIVGSLVSTDQRSAMIFVPLVEVDAETGKGLDYRAFRDELNKIREFESQGVKIHIIGFAQLFGDLIHGMIEVFQYFVYAIAIVSAFIFLYTRCVRSTLIVILCSLGAVIWQLGLMQLIGLVLDPYSVLVPFLIFAIGVSHGAQKMNGIMEDIGRGTHRYVAARYTFRRLFVAGLTAILCDAIGFAVLMIIDIPVIQSLAVSASIGVAVLALTNLILLPVLLSYTGVSPRAAARKAASMGQVDAASRFLQRFTERRWAVGAIAATAVITAVGVAYATKLQIGDLDAGAPELRPDSQYNRDNAYITSHYALSSDQFAIIVATPEQGLVDFESMLEMDRLEEQLRDLPGVQTTVSAASLARLYTAAGFEGSEKWVTINRDQFVIGDALNYVYDSNPELVSGGRAVAPIVVYLTDHKAETLQRVVKVVEEFASAHNTENRKFLLAAGNAGVEAATNIAVRDANRTMLLYVYAAVVLMCYVTFRSWRAVIVAIIPLIVTSVLCEALTGC